MSDDTDYTPMGASTRKPKKTGIAEVWLLENGRYAVATDGLIHRTSYDQGEMQNLAQILNHRPAAGVPRF